VTTTPGTYGPHHIGVARYLTNGALDSSFGNGGKVLTVVSANSEGRRALLDGSGRLVVGGEAANTDFASMVVARYCTICAPVTYSDVPPDSTFYPYITCLSGKSIIAGYPDCTYRPGNVITRGDMAEAISKAAGYNEAIPPSRRSFTDVSNGYNYWLYVERLVAHGVVGGYSDGTYRADNGVTRGQMAKFISIAAGYNEAIPYTRQTFSDVPPSDTFWVYIERLVAHGVVGGYTDGTYRPSNLVTRGQIAKFIGNTFFPGCSTALAPGK
jgi:hypothetical protein